MATLSVRQAAKVLGYSEKTVLRYLASGAIRATRVGRGRWRISEEHVRELAGIQEHSSASAKKQEVGV